jgi:GTP-binding protein HflX
VNPIKEKVIVVGVKTRNNLNRFESSLQELQGLVETAGGEVAAILVQTREHPLASTYIGKGKITELQHLAEELEPDLIVFDSELTPVQLRNLENVLDTRIVDRTLLILDIFSQRAQSSAGKLQVELAALEYRLPRLTGKGQEMSRLGAGIGTRGAGEQKLELDRRYLRRRINDLKKDIQKLNRTRAIHRLKRARAGLKEVSLVGYTNAGKSSLFNALCRIGHTSGTGQAEAGNQLFQTLDTTTRKIRLPHGREFLLTDTVGFIQNLPHHLVAAFKSTLEETIEADLILHIVDVSQPDYLDKIDTVEEVLDTLGAEKSRIVTVFNKIDLMPGLNTNQPGLMVSAHTGQGLYDLLQLIGGALPNPGKIMQKIHGQSPEDGSKMN